MRRHLTDAEKARPIAYNSGKIVIIVIESYR
jgi:hypothetical protein